MEVQSRWEADMRKQALILIFFALMVGLAVPALAQTGTVKGYVHDENGKPVVGAQVDMTNLDNGQKRTLKTDKEGKIFSIGVPLGTYKVVVTQNGQVIYNINKFPVGGGDDSPAMNIDLAKDKAAAATNPANAEAIAKNEAVKKENEKIGNVNKLLTQATEAMKANNFDQAVQIMQQAVEVDQTHDLVYGRYGDALLGDKKYPEAADAFTKAIALKPDVAAYHNNLAQAYAKSGQNDKAIVEYQKAAELDPQNAALYWFNVGAVETNTGKVDDAIAAFDKVIAADPTKADAYYWKGVNLVGKATTSKDGKFEAPAGTAEAFNKYLELQPTGKYADATKQMLETIGAKVDTSYGKTKKK